jgi:hypothetical protein
VQPSPLQPIAIIGSTIVIQLALLVILAGGVWFDRTHLGKVTRAANSLLIILLAIVSLVAIVSIDSFSTILAPMFSDVALPSFSRSTGLRAAFMADFVIVGVLITRTGGSRQSPYTSVLFLLPTLAVFLREPPSAFIFYGILGGVWYLVWSGSNGLVSYGSASDESDRSLLSHRFVTITCLALALLIGYITRPV